MRSDLKELEISSRELSALSGANVDKVLRSPVVRACSSPLGLLRWMGTFGLRWLQHRLLQVSLPKEFRGGLPLTPTRVLRHVFWGGMAFFILNAIFPNFTLLGPAFIVAIAFGFFSYWVRLQDKILREASLSALLEDVDQHNSLLRAIDVNDQLRAVVEQDVGGDDRERTLQALQINRDDLLRAFKLERILRENRDIVTTNPGMFATNLQSIQALRVSDRSSEYGVLLEESLQLALSIREEMENMRNRHSLTE